MKKTLYSTTALAAAGMMSLGAGDANAADPLKIGVGGYYKFMVGYADQDSSFEDARGAQYSTVQMVNDAEIYFTGNTTLDNGIRVDVIIQLEADQAESNDANNTIDESYVKLTGGFGDLRMGATKFAGFVLSKNAPFTGIMHTYNPETAKFIVNPVPGMGGGITAGNQFSTMTDTSVIDSNKMVYFTPKFSGFQAGVSYMPSGSEDDRVPMTASTNARNNNRQMHDYAATWDGKMGDVTLGVSGVYWVVEGGQNAGADGGPSSTGFGFGARVGFAGFTVGGAYGEVDDGRDNLGRTVRSVDEESWNVGIQYRTGPLAVGASWGAVRRPDTAAVAGDAESNIYALGASYVVGPGIVAGANLVMAEYKDEVTAAANSNEGWAAVAGIRVAF